MTVLVSAVPPPALASPVAAACASGSAGTEEAPAVGPERCETVLEVGQVTAVAVEAVEVVSADANAASVEELPVILTREQVVEALFAPTLAEPVADSLSRHLLGPDLPAPAGAAAAFPAAARLQAGVDGAVQLLDECIARVGEGHDAAGFPNVLLHLAAELRAMGREAAWELRDRLGRTRHVDYRALVERRRNLESAMAHAEGPTADAVLRLLRQVQDRLRRLEDETEAMDRALSRLCVHDEQVERVLGLWADRKTIVTAGVAECRILQEDFCALFQGR